MTSKGNSWVLLYAHINHVLTYTTNVYIAAAYLAIMLLSLLAYCREDLRDKECLYHLNTAKANIFPSEKFVAKFSGLFFNFQVL